MKPLDLFFSYSHHDEKMRNLLERHFALLKRQGLVKTWHDRRITAGKEWKDEIDDRLTSSELILPLVSASFINSEYCFSLELSAAMRLHKARKTRVIPVLLAPCDWKSSPLGGLQALPEDAKPITTWDNWDEAFLQVALELRRTIQEIQEENLDPTNHLQRPTDRKLFELYEKQAHAITAGEQTSAIDAQIKQIKKEATQEQVRLTAGDYFGAGQYKLIEKIGVGGFASIWKAFDKTRNGLVALKILHSQYSDDRSRRSRFFRGARQMLKLQDLSGVVDITDPKRQDGIHHFYSMEYINGPNFRDHVINTNPKVNDILRIIIKLSETIETVHYRGIIHRDIKPDNILIDTSQEAKLTDFDLVRANDTNSSTRTSKLGTFLYAAPEAMVDASQSTPKTDLYSLGMTLIFALYGRDLPAEAFYERELFIHRLDVTDSLKRILIQSTERNPGHRFDSAKSMCNALKTQLSKDDRPESFRQQQEPSPSYFDSLRKSTAPIKSSFLKKPFKAALDLYLEKGYEPILIAGIPDTGKTQLLEAIKSTEPKLGEHSTTGRVTPTPPGHINTLPLSTKHKKVVFIDTSGEYFHSLYPKAKEQLSAIDTQLIKKLSPRLGGLIMLVDLTRYWEQEKQTYKSFDQEQVLSWILCLIRYFFFANLSSVKRQELPALDLLHSQLLSWNREKRLPIPILVIFSRADLIHSQKIPKIGPLGIYGYERRLFPVAEAPFFLARHKLPRLFGSLRRHAVHYRFDFAHSITTDFTGRITSSKPIGVDSNIRWLLNSIQHKNILPLSTDKLSSLQRFIDIILGRTERWSSLRPPENFPH